MSQIPKLPKLSKKKIIRTLKFINESPSFEGSFDDYVDGVPSQEIMEFYFYNIGIFVNQLYEYLNIVDLKFTRAEENKCMSYLYPVFSAALGCHYKYVFFDYPETGYLTIDDFLKVKVNDLEEIGVSSRKMKDALRLAKKRNSNVKLGTYIQNEYEDSEEGTFDHKVRALLEGTNLQILPIVYSKLIFSFLNVIENKTRQLYSSDRKIEILNTVFLHSLLPLCTYDESKSELPSKNDWKKYFTKHQKSLRYGFQGDMFDSVRGKKGEPIVPVLLHMTEMEMNNLIQSYLYLSVSIGYDESVNLYNQFFELIVSDEEEQQDAA